MRCNYLTIVFYVKTIIQKEVFKLTQYAYVIEAIEIKLSSAQPLMPSYTLSGSYLLVS